jgi:hypothetical protein
MQPPPQNTAQQHSVRYIDSSIFKEKLKKSVAAVRQQQQQQQQPLSSLDNRENLSATNPPPSQQQQQQQQQQPLSSLDNRENLSATKPSPLPSPHESSLAASTDENEASGDESEDASFAASANENDASGDESKDASFAASANENDASGDESEDASTTSAATANVHQRCISYEPCSSFRATSFITIGWIEPRRSTNDSISTKATAIASD